MSGKRLAAAAVLVTLTVPTIAACGTGDDTSERSRPPAATTSFAAPTASESPQPTHDTDEDAAMKIQISINGQHLQATLDDSAASRDLVAQLPQSIDMRDHGGVEKTGHLSAPLSLDGQPSGTDPEVGDVGYYAPGNDFVLYYGDRSYFEGIVVLGRLDRDAADRIAQVEGSASAHVDVLG
jgi:hypothetical protein